MTLELILSMILSAVLFAGVQIYLFRRRMRQRLLDAIEQEARRRLQEQLKLKFGAALINEMNSAAANHQSPEKT